MMVWAKRYGAVSCVLVSVKEGSSLYILQIKKQPFFMGGVYYYISCSRYLTSVPLLLRSLFTRNLLSRNTEYARFSFLHRGDG